MDALQDKIRQKALLSSVPGSFHYTAGGPMPVTPSFRDQAIADEVMKAQRIAAERDFPSEEYRQKWLRDRLEFIARQR